MQTFILIARNNGAFRRKMLFGFFAGIISTVASANDGSSRIDFQHQCRPLETVDLLIRNVPLNKSILEQVFGRPILNPVQNNNSHVFYEMLNVKLSNGVDISRVDYRENRIDPKLNSVALDFGNDCISFADVKQLYPALELKSPPRGPGSLSIYAATQEWGILSFGFSSENEGVLKLAVIAPNQKTPR